MALKRINGTEEYLFCGPRGQFWLYRDYKQDYERLLDSHNIDSQKMFPYRFRHTVCTRLLRQGHSLKAVQLVMGDNTPDMILRVYANLNKEDVFKAGDKLAEELDLVYTNDGGKEDDEASKDNEV